MSASPGSARSASSTIASGSGTKITDDLISHLEAIGASSSPSASFKAAPSLTGESIRGGGG